MQVMGVGAARSLLGLAEANSSEFAPDTPHPVISLLVEQEGVTDKGATMRLGAYPCRPAHLPRPRPGPPPPPPPPVVGWCGGGVGTGGPGAPVQEKAAVSKVAP